MASILEGFVSQLLADYLSNYVQGIHPEQVRLGLWNGIAQLENVDLRLGAFEYLQLPIAIKNGVVGKLKIQVPWKKLGREPILIVLEDIFLRACPRDEFEWKSEALEARSLAAKKANLASAELAKLSARLSDHVSDDQSSQSFFSYLSTKILDNIQVIARNVHFQYVDQKTDPEMVFSFGIKFSHLMINTEQTFSGASAAKLKPNLVNKVVEIKDFSIYWNSGGFKESDASNDTCLITKCENLIQPFNTTIRLTVNKNPVLDGSSPQYSVVLESDNLDFTLEDRQLHQMLLLWDALSICQMREKYGRFRPAVGQQGYTRKDDGWQKIWWHYAVNAVLVDVRKNLRRSAWSYLGWRIDMRRKYVLLYREKLDCLWIGKPAVEQSLRRLEELEKDLELDEILAFRSTAESSLEGQTALDRWKEAGGSGKIDSRSETKPGDLSSWKHRSWLNFLSLGMLGAAGKDTASEQFAGILPNDVIEDIFEATRYPPPDCSGDGVTLKGFCRLAITFSINGVSIVLRKMHLKEVIALLDLQTIDVRIRVWHQSTKILVAVKSFKAADRCQNSSSFPIVLGNEGTILPPCLETGPCFSGEEILGVRSPDDARLLKDVHSTEPFKDPFIFVEVDMLLENSECHYTIKITIQPMEFVYSPMLMSQLNSFINRPTSLQTLRDLIFSSLNRLQSPEVRLQSKAELTLAMGKHVTLLIVAQRPVLIFPKNLQLLDTNHLIVTMSLLKVKSLDHKDVFCLEMKNEKKQHPQVSRTDGISLWPKNSVHGEIESIREDTLLNEFDHPAIYNKFHLQLTQVLAIVTSDVWKWQKDSRVSSHYSEFDIAKSFDAEAVLEICALPDEPALTRFKLYGDIPSLHLVFSLKKWEMLKSVFSNDVEKNMANSSLFSAASPETSQEEAFNDEYPPPIFKLELVSKSISLFFHLENITTLHSSVPLLMKGEDVVLTFVDSGAQQKLEFFVAAVHIDQAPPKIEDGSFLSMHSVSTLSVTALFEPKTIWKWALNASEIIVLVRGGANEKEFVVVNIDGMEHFGFWKDDNIHCMSVKVTNMTVRSGCRDLVHQNENSKCHLCPGKHFYILSALEQLQNDEIFHLSAKELSPGLEMSLSVEGQMKQILIAIPFSCLTLRLLNWRIFLKLFSLYSSREFNNVKDKVDVPEIADRFLKEEPDMLPSTQDDHSGFVVKGPIISIELIFPELFNASSVNEIDGSVNSSTFGEGFAGDSSINCPESSVFTRVSIKVKSLCYRWSVYNLKASFLKCKVDLKDCNTGLLRCFPLLQLTGVSMESDVKPCHTTGRRSLDVRSCLINGVDIWCSHSTLHLLRSLKFEERTHNKSIFEVDAITLTASLQRGSILLTDERWNYSAPIFDLRVKKLNSQIGWKSSEQLVCTISTLFEADYHDLEKVAWEPFWEQSDLSCDFCLKFGFNIPVQLVELKITSPSHLNINLTKALFEAWLRAADMLANATRVSKSSKASQKGRFRGYAPYWLQNDTGVRLKYWLTGGSKLEETDAFYANDLELQNENVVDPGCSVPINIQRKSDQVVHIGRSNSSSERLSDKRLYGGYHKMISVQLEGTTTASCLLSMDLVGVHTFNAPFSHTYSNILVDGERKENFKTESNSSEIRVVEGHSTAFQMPVVYEVSRHYDSKIIRIYSTVSLVNATSIPMEARFDIPFGVLPKVMEPIFPGEAIPLPVYLAETGQIRWRPMGGNHLWSEAQSLSHILMTSKLGTLRTFVSYPSNPNNAIFRCCIMVQESMNPISPLSTVSEQQHDLSKSSWERNIPSSHLKKDRFPRFPEVSIPMSRQLVLQAPFVFKNCLPVPMTLMIQSTAEHHLNLPVPECDSVFVLEANPAHDLELILNVPGFTPVSTKVTSATSLLDCYKESAKNDITLIEAICLFPDCANGHNVYCKAEIVYNIMSGAREVSAYVPFWIYNLSGVNLEITDDDGDSPKVSSNQVVNHFSAGFSALEDLSGSFHMNSAGLESVMDEPSWSVNRVYAHGRYCGTTTMRSVGGKRIISCTPSQATSVSVEDYAEEFQHLKPNMYSPAKDMELGDNRLRARVATIPSSKAFLLSDENLLTWSRPFVLSPPGGINTIVVPLPKGGGGWILTVVSAPVLGASAQKTRSITFQPRFVLANTCHQDLCYRQQGTDKFQYLPKGKQVHLFWSDMSRPLLVSLRFNQNGWDWSGAFLPDQLGDTQLKMRNLLTGATQILRVEVQNANSLDGDSNAISSTDNSLGTNLVLLSDDESGYMPYRIENFSLERLRFFQSKCPDYESTLLPYSSCMYAWDEPWCPHQLVVEIPGEFRLGTFDLDDVKEYPTVPVPATNQKPERCFSACVHAEGPTRVLSFQDLDLHPKKDIRRTLLQQPLTQSTDEYMGCNFTLNFLWTSIGISVIDVSPQEILFVTAKEVTLQLLQSPDEQTLTFNVSYIQLDNQLPLAQYPVMLLGGVRSMNETVLEEERSLTEPSNSTERFASQSAFTFVVSKWRHFKSSVECFQKIHARFAPIQVQLDEQIVSCLIEFINISHDMGINTTQADQSAPGSILAESSTFAYYKYWLLMDPQSSQLRFIKTLDFKSIYRCWPASQAIRCFRSETLTVLSLAKGGRKVYIESLQVAPIELTVSFSSISWMDRHTGSKLSQSVLGDSGPLVQRSLMALLDIEGAPVQLRQLDIAHPLARWDAIRGMIIRHYTRQLLHEVYKVLGSAGFLGNPRGFMKSLGSGVRDFVSAPAKSFVQSPRQLVGGFAEGTQSLVNNTVFAVSTAATLISRAAKKGVTSLAVGLQQEPGFQDYGVISELLEGLTGLLQSPLTGAKRHGLPGILSGVAVGAVGVIARPIASILEVAGRTAQSIRSWSQPIQQSKRMRPPRYLLKGCPILPYSWEEAIGNAVLREASGLHLQNEVYVTCKSAMEKGRYVVLTERFVLIVRSLPETTGGGAGPHWTVETQIRLDDILHVERNEEMLNVLMGSPRNPSRNKTSKKRNSSYYKRQLPSAGPLIHESIKMAQRKDAEDFLACLTCEMENRSKGRTTIIS